MEPDENASGAADPDAGDNPYDPIPWEIVEDWKRALDVSDRTRDAYDLGLRVFCGFARDCGTDFDQLTAQNVRDFRHHLSAERGLSPATVSAYLAAVRSFYRYSEDDRDVKDIARNVKGGKLSRAHKKNALTPDEARSLLATVDRSTLRGKRDFAILSTMLRTGLRDIEVSRATVGDIGKKGGERVLYVHGKGRATKDEFVVLTPQAYSPIKEYLKERGAVKSEDPLFASTARINPGGQLSTRTVSKIAKMALMAIGLTDERYTAHSLRHTSITFALKGGATEREVQQMARHADFATTAIYSHDLDRIENAAEYKIGVVLDDM